MRNTPTQAPHRRSAPATSEPPLYVVGPQRCPQMLKTPGRHPWTAEPGKCFGPHPGWPGRPQTVAPAGRAEKGADNGDSRRRRAVGGRRTDGGWRAVAGGSTLGVARTAPVVDARHRRESRDTTFFRRGAQLPGRPQDEAHISTERPQAGEAARLPSPDVDQGGAGHPVGSPAQGSSQPVSLIWAVRDRATFEALRRGGRRVRRGPITVTWLEGDPAEPPRVAYAIGRRAGGAVVRNRIRRRLRAITQEERVRLRPGAYLIGATAAASSLSYRDLRATVCQALGALHRS